MARALRCPRDGAKARLQEKRGRFGRFAIDVCSKCGGVWFDRGEIAKVTRNREVERLIVEYAAGRSGLPCPRCGREMIKRPVSQVTLDVCTNCEGVWADRGELATALRRLGGGMALEASGLDFGRSLHARDLLPLAFFSPRTYRRVVGYPGRKASKRRRI